MPTQIQNDHRVAHVIGMQLRHRRGGVPLRGTVSREANAHWDHDVVVPEPEVLVEVTPSSRPFRRQRHRDVRSTQKKQGRKAFKEAQEAKRTVALLVTWGRVYLQGAGTPEQRRNVVYAVQRQAELYSKSHGEPYSKSLKRLEEAMLGALVKHRAQTWTPTTTIRRAV